MRRDILIGSEERSFAGRETEDECVYGEGSLQGNAWASAKNHLLYNNILIDGLIGANDSIIADCGTLCSCVGSEDLIEEDILETRRLEEQTIRDCTSEIGRCQRARPARTRKRICDYEHGI